jgi:hypothetical protein
VILKFIQSYTIYQIYYNIHKNKHRAQSQSNTSSNIMLSPCTHQKIRCQTRSLHPKLRNWVCQVEEQSTIHQHHRYPIQHNQKQLLKTKHNITPDSGQKPLAQNHPTHLHIMYLVISHNTNVLTSPTHRHRIFVLIDRH